LLRRFARSERGLAAVEFALIAPVLVATYMGMAELSMAMMAERRASHAASVVADLVSQSSQINQTQVSDIFDVGDAIMAPFPSDGLSLRVSSVRKVDDKTAPTVVWSRGQGLDALGAVTPAGFPPNLLVAGDSVIMAEVRYVYASPLQQILPAAVTYNRTFYLRPRRATEVAWAAG
jgi:Flp pilus assembly protein TadG